MAFDPAVLAAFILAGLLLNITPGVDFLLVTSSGINGGGAVGRAAGWGINLGIVVHILLAAAGVSALLSAYPLAYDAIRYAGAAYLLWIAYKAWTDSGELAQGAAALTRRDAFRRGLITNLLNPKTALFIFAFLPQFTDPALGAVGAQILILGAIFTVNGLLFTLILGTLAGRLGPALRGQIRILNKLTAILFGGLAVRLATQ
ncbi:Transmembrane amino acid efflux protein [Candidatus Rhodobacter oscarellae]|uniref:Transmembrane amino acid efflux protein n=1 Tax=Candidatus Rhodobacter oscarellae TaxID=1675527 RepID=A0A0J9E645_9RHOB|nr:Transmembrane amino acid efflux protein [Candidatus Rhodobacter lobularis]